MPEINVEIPEELLGGLDKTSLMIEKSSADMMSSVYRSAKRLI